MAKDIGKFRSEFEVLRENWILNAYWNKDLKVPTLIIYRRPNCPI